MTYLGQPTCSYPCAAKFYNLVNACNHHTPGGLKYQRILSNPNGQLEVCHNPVCPQYIVKNDDTTFFKRTGVVTEPKLGCYFRTLVIRDCPNPDFWAGSRGSAAICTRHLCTAETAGSIKRQQTCLIGSHARAHHCQAKRGETGHTLVRPTPSCKRLTVLSWLQYFSCSSQGFLTRNSEQPARDF
jgi:hypothetical protein